MPVDPYWPDQLDSEQRFPLVCLPCLRARLGRRLAQLHHRAVSALLTRRARTYHAVLVGG